MIFVITGMHEHPFDRLVRAVDVFASEGILKDVFIQSGYSTYEPRHCAWCKAIDFEEFEKVMVQSEVIITHGGAGSIAGALERNKPTIVVPRLKRYGEHNNDHQLELVFALEQAGRIIAVNDVSQLPAAVVRARSFVPGPPTGQSRIVDIIRSFLIRAAKGN